MLTIKNKKKLFTRFLPILLCLMLLAGAASPAVPSQTYAQGEDDLIISPVPAVDFAADTSLDTSDSLLESVPENAAEQMAEGNTVYDEETPAESASEDDVTDGIDDTEPGTLTPPTLIADSTDNTVGNPIELTFTDDEGWRNAVKEVTVNDSAIASDDYTLAADKLTIDASVFTDPGEYTIVIKADGYEDATVAQTLTQEPPYIVSIIPVDDVQVPCGTLEADAIAALASETTITDSDGATHTVALEWTITDYDGNTPGAYTATGTFELPEGVEQSDPPLELKVTATVTVKSGEQELVPVTSVNISESDQVLLVGKTVQLTAVVEPEDATDKSVIWSSSDDDVATVDETGLVKAVAEGEAEITVTTTDGRFTDSITVTVAKLKITGDGVIDTIGFTLDDLKEMQGSDAWVGPRVYSTINTWPTKKWYAVEGVKLSTLLRAAKIKDEAQQIKVRATDGYVMTFTVQELLKDKRYYFPNFKEGDGDADGHIPGSTEGKEQVEAIIALKSVEGSNDLGYLEEEVAQKDCPLLVLGQRWVTEQTNHTFVKDVIEIEVLTQPPSKWAAPEAEPAEGEVPVGTEVVLKTESTNGYSKIYYTTDGSEPTLQSPIYNWSSSDDRDDLEEINKPIEITKDTIIKAKTIGFGREDSEVATFKYTVLPGGPGVDPVPVTGVSISEGDQVLKVGETVQLTAVVEPEDATDKSVTWSSDKEAVATVDETGLVTAKSDGEATITVTTNSGGFTDSIKVVVGPFLTITGDGVEKTTYFSLAEISDWKTERPDDWVGPRVYSTINTWPTKKWYAAEGVKLTALLGEAKIKGSARLIKVKSVDGYAMTFTRKELLEDTRYYFPNFKEEGVDGDGHIPGSPEGAEPVDAILALKSVEGSDNPGYMNHLNCPLLVLGQRAVTEQTNHTFVKNVSEIEVLTEPPLKWKAPEAEPAGGEVPVGTEVELTNEFNDSDKIYYTTDGSDPTLDSPIYNWVASRWWLQRGKETVAKINRPIVITEDTIIKAKTIGFGREDSDIVTFTYKVIPKKTSESSEIKPDEGGTVSLDDEAIIEIPAGALAGTGAQEVKIERVEAPPAAPSGFKLLSDVFEFTIGGKKNYTFNKKVTITLSFDPKAVGKGETPSIHRYDEDLRQWINLGGEISNKDNTISVEVDHFSKFAVMAALPSSVTATIKPGEGGTVSLGDEAAIEIPAGALGGSKAVEVKIERVEAPPAPPIGFKLLGDAFEFSIDGKKSYNFAKEVTITLSFDPKAVGKGETPSIHCYDEELAQWENLGGEVSGSTISVKVDHFTKFAVMVELPSSVTVLIEPGEGGTVNLGNEVSIEIPPGALTGSKAVEVKIERVKSPPAPPAGFKLLSDVFEFTIDGKKSYRFAEEVTIKFGFDPKAAVDVEENPGINYYDEQSHRWVNLGGEVSGHTVTVQMDHFTKFAVIGKIKPILIDIAGHWAENNINKLVSLGAISGYPDRTFRPNNNITRAEFITALVKAFRVEGQGGKTFTDTVSHWAKDSIAVAAASGIASGYDGDVFRPDDVITREQMAAMIMKAAKLTPIEKELAFIDSDSISTWARQAVVTVTENGIMKGYPDNTVRPQGNATRAEAVTVIVNALPEP